MDDCDTVRSVTESSDEGGRAAAHLDFDELYSHYAPRLKRYFLNAGRSPSEAEELTQDVMLKVWSKLETYEAERAALSTWMYRIARNRLIDVVRGEARHVPDSLGFKKEPTDLSSPNSSLPLGVETRQLLERALGVLPEPQLEVIRGSLVEGRTLKEVAFLTKEPLGTVKTRARLALTKLRAFLDSEEGE